MFSFGDEAKKRGVSVGRVIDELVNREGEK